MRRACIDIGSNTTRLLVAESDGPRLLEVHQERSFTKIGHAVRQDGLIADEKLAEVARVVSEQLMSALEMGAKEVRCVATAAIRRAANGDELVERIRQACGVQVEILSGADEARLAFLGAARTMDHDPAGLLGVVDVGGGSSEMVVGAVPDSVQWWASFAIGSGDIAEDCLGSDPPSIEEFEHARQRVASALEGVTPPAAAEAIAVGGSATSLRRLAGPVLDAAAFTRSLTVLSSERAGDLARRFALDLERVRLLPAGILILEAVSALFDAPLQIGRGGVREGVLLEAGDE